MNSQQHQPHFIARRLEDYKKATQRPLSCHLCAVAAQFRGEKDFLEHVRQTHPDAATDAPNGPAWRHIVQTAAAKAKGRETTRRLPIEQPSLSRRSSTDSMKLNYDGDGRSSSIPSRPGSAFVSRSTEPRIDEFKRLSLENNTPGLVPKKRSAGLHSPSETKGSSGNLGSTKSRRTRDLSGGRDADFDRGKQSSSRKLFDPSTDTASFGKSSSPYTSRSQELRGHNQRSHREQPTREHRHSRSVTSAGPSRHGGHTLRAIPVHINEEASRADSWEDDEPELLLQPETSPITQEQLVHEVKGIYTGLCMVEQKAIDVDEQQLEIAQDPDPEKRTKLKPEQWSALIALHKTLLHEHHDFFLASQHPAADSSLVNLGRKYSMPERMWKHGVHTFLEVLRLNLPDSYDFMLTFVNISYALMALLYETVREYRSIWIERLGDLGRYRLLIADNDLQDRDVWAGVARYWYLMKLNKQPEATRPYSLNQLSLYCRATTTWIGFEDTHARMMELFNPLLAGQLSRRIKQNSMETMLITCLGVLFTGRSTAEYSKYCDQIIDQGNLSKYIDKTGSKFKEIGVSIAISVLAGLLEFGATRDPPSKVSRSIIRRALESEHKQKYPGQTFSTDIDDSEPAESSEVPEEEAGLMTPEEIDLSSNSILHASKLTFGIFRVALEWLTCRNIIPMVHVFMAFIKTVARYSTIMEQIESEVPWDALVGYLNHYTNPGTMTKTCLSPEFPKPPEEAIGRPLPEDFMMRGLVEFFDYFPSNWFSDADVEEDEQPLELPSMASPRLSRILWTGIRLASHQKWIRYNSATFRFAVTDYGKSLQPRSLPASFGVGVLPKHLESQLPPARSEELTIDILKAKQSNTNSELPESASSPRTVRTPQILKRETRLEDLHLSPTTLTPTKHVRIAGPDYADAAGVLDLDDT